MTWIDPHEIRMRSGQMHMAMDDAMDDALIKRMGQLGVQVLKLAKAMEKQGITRPLVAHCLTGVVIGAVFHEEIET
jgi:hypothetical protein